MCLAVPGKVETIIDSTPLRPAIVAFAGVRKQVSLALTPDANNGDYVLVHAGFAITRVDEAEAVRLLQDLRALEVQE